MILYTQKTQSLQVNQLLNVSRWLRVHITLHKDMNRAQWADAFGKAYEHFCKRVDDWEDNVIDDYAAESPGEFFAVMSEAFFEKPQAVRCAYPDVYAQLALFYRQDPAARLARAPVA